MCQVTVGGQSEVARAIGLLEAKGASSLAARLWATPCIAPEAIGAAAEGLEVTVADLLSPCTTLGSQN